MRNKVTTTISKENYLKTVYNYAKGEGDTITTSVIAEKLNVSNAATSEMAKKLSHQNLVTYERYKGVGLTPRGKRIALKVIRRHRLWELFLHDVLDISWGEVHNEAEMLEHSTTDFLIDKVDEYLGFPQFDPHGSPIPNSNLEMPEIINQIVLTEAQEGKEYALSKVTDKSTELINYITELGLTLNCKFKVLKKLSFDNSIGIKVGENVHSLSEKVCSNLFVTEL